MQWFKITNGVKNRANVSASSYSSWFVTRGYKIKLAYRFTLLYEYENSCWLYNPKQGILVTILARFESQINVPILFWNILTKRDVLLEIMREWWLFRFRPRSQYSVINSTTGKYCSEAFIWMATPQVAKARNMSIGEHRHCCLTFKIRVKI